MYIVPIGGSMLTLSQIEVNSMFFCGIRVSFSVLCFADIVCLFLFVVVLSNLLFWLVITPFCLSLYCLSFCFGLWLPLFVCRCIVYPALSACDYPFGIFKLFLQRDIFRVECVKVQKGLLNPFLSSWFVYPDRAVLTWRHRQPRAADQLTAYRKSNISFEHFTIIINI